MIMNSLDPDHDYYKYKPHSLHQRSQLNCRLRKIEGEDCDCIFCEKDRALKPWPGMIVRPIFNIHSRQGIITWPKGTSPVLTDCSRLDPKDLAVYLGSVETWRPTDLAEMIKCFILIMGRPGVWITYTRLITSL